MEDRRASREHCRFFAWYFLVILVTGAGCNHQSGVEVAGEVTFGGKAVPAGRIYFNPDFTKGNDGPQGYAAIEDGKFDTRKEGKGVVGGPSIVVIQGFDGVGKDGTPPSLGNRLFDDYQVSIELPKTASVQKFEVPASAARKSKPAPSGPKI